MHNARVYYLIRGSKINNMSNQYTFQHKLELGKRLFEVSSGQQLAWVVRAKMVGVRFSSAYLSMFRPDGTPLYTVAVGYPEDGSLACNYVVASAPDQKQVLLIKNNFLASKFTPRWLIQDVNGNEIAIIEGSTSRSILKLLLGFVPNKYQIKANGQVVGSYQEKYQFLRVFFRMKLVLDANCRRSFVVACRGYNGKLR